MYVDLINIKLKLFHVAAYEICYEMHEKNIFAFFSKSYLLEIILSSFYDELAQN